MHKFKMLFPIVLHAIPSHTFEGAQALIPQPLPSHHMTS